MSFKYNQTTLNTLESIFKSNHYVIRYEKGRFQSVYCILHDKRVVVVNKFFETEARINALLDILQQIKVDATLLDEKQVKLYDQLSQHKLELE